MKNTVVLMLSLLVSISCLGQIFNPVLNDAFLLPRRGFQVTAGYSALGLAANGERQGFYNSLDFQVGYGLSPRVNLVARYEKSWYVDEIIDGSASNFFVGPEFSLKENRISVYVPFGTRFIKGMEDSYFEIAPTINFSLPLGSIFYFNPAAEVSFVICEDCTSAPFVGVNLGLGVRPSDVLSFFAEYGLTYATEDFESGHFYSLNAGVSYRISPSKNTK